MKEQIQLTKGAQAILGNYLTKNGIIALLL